jgi:hypothetical protein
MSRVTLSVLAAAAVSLSAGTAYAGCGCSADVGYVSSYTVVQPAPRLVTVQPAPVVVAVPQPPVVVRTVTPVVQQYVVNQGPVYSGPMLTDYNPAIYYPPKVVPTYPYVGGHRWAGYGRAYAPRPYHARPAYHRHHHHRHGHPPISRYN